MSAKDDILKQIKETVKRKKTLSKENKKERTVALWVSEYFKEVEKAKAVGCIETWNSLRTLAMTKLIIDLRSIDRKCYVVSKYLIDEYDLVEIKWSNKFIEQQQCEAVLVMDASTAHFQSAMEQID